jgi:diadenosine tetraphosphate (Ap4A) HIT family hydrolase
VATVFTRIINGELPAHFVWQDRECVAFLSIAPLRPGHTLVVPRLEIDHWLDADPQLMSHLTATAQVIGKAQMAAFHPTRVGMVLAGLEVPHVHLHVVPIRGMQDLNFANADAAPDDGMMDDAAAAILRELKGMGLAGSAAG